MAHKAASPFLRALTDLLDGARHAHELAEVLVTEAVQRTLARVVADYPLDFTSLLKKYEDDVVRECCALFEHTEVGAACGAMTKAGKPCARRAVVDGACGQHLGARREQQAAHRRQDAYVTALASKATDPYVAELQNASKKRTVSMAFSDDAMVADAL